MFGFVGFVGRGIGSYAQHDTSTRPAIIAAMRRGLKTPGSIASAAKLGATDTYQELDRMAQEGFVTIQRNGELGLSAAADLGRNPDLGLPVAGLAITTTLLERIKP